MNKALIAPIAAVLYLLISQIFHTTSVTQSDLETFINVVAAVVAGFGVFMHPNKPQDPPV